MACMVIVLCLMAAITLPESNAPPKSGLEAARKKLEELQWKAYSNIGVFPKQYSEKELEAADRESDERLLASAAAFPHTPEDIEKLRQDLAEGRKYLKSLQLPTKYQDRRAYETLMTIANQIERKAAEFHTAHPTLPSAIPNVSQIVFGTLPTGQVDALTYEINPEEKNRDRKVFLVVFESGLFQFAEILSDCIANALPPADPKGALLGLDMNREAVERYLDLQPNLVRDFSNALQVYLLHGGPSLSNPYPERELVEPRATFATMLERGALVFALGHEYGHVLFRQNVLTVDPRLPQGWSEEYFADGWGMTISMMATGRRTTLETTILGARFFLLCFDLIERGISMIETGTDVYRAKTNHPPADRRLEKFSRYILTALKNYWGLQPESLTEFNAMISQSEQLDVVFEVLWERIKPQLLQLHSQGAKVAPSWGPLAVMQN